MRAARLLRSPFLSVDERERLSSALSSPKSILRNKVLLYDGDPTESLYVIFDGWACRSTVNVKGGRHYSSLFVAGDLCNLGSLLFGKVDYDVRALTDLSVAGIHRAVAADLCERHPGIARTFIWLAVVENNILSQRTMSLGRRSSTERLAHLLCELSVRLGADGQDATSFHYSLTQEHLADLLGLTSVHVNRVTRVLREAGLIELNGKVMRLPDPEGLHRICGFDGRYLHANPVQQEPA